MMVTEKNISRDGADASRLKTPRRVLVVYNPVAGRRRRRRLRDVLRHLADAGCAVTLYPTRARGDAESVARRAGEEDWDVVAVAGGDGTISEVANGLYGRTIPLAVIPWGTANVVAAETGVPRDAAAIARMIARGESKPVYLGRANGRLFVMMAGVGFDARVVAAVRAGMKRLLGKGAYVVASLAGLARFSRGDYQVDIDGKRHRAASAVIAKGRFYAGRFTCTPLACLDEPTLHVCLFLTPGPLAALRYSLWLMLGRLHRLPDVRVLPARTVKIDGPAGEVVQGDGDLIAALPLTVDVAETPLRLVVPCTD